VKALWFSDKLELLEKLPVPTPDKNEALIKVLVAGICNTDLEIVKGYMNFKGVIGHEFVGRVVEINGESKELQGKRVVGEINCGCGQCPLCRKGLERHCQEREVLGIQGKNGCFAEYITLPLKNLHEVPDAVDDEKAVFVEPLAAALEILDQVHFHPGDKVLVLGDGKLGVLIALALRQTMADIMLAGKHNSKMKVVFSQGIQTKHIDEVSADSDRFDYVVEATGSSSGLETAFQLLRPRGTVILKSTYAGGKNIDLAPAVINEITIIGSRCGCFPPALNYLDKYLDTKPMISAVFKFKDALKAIDLAGKKESLKVLLDMR